MIKKERFGDKKGEKMKKNRIGTLSVMTLLCVAVLAACGKEDSDIQQDEFEYEESYEDDMEADAWEDEDEAGAYDAGEEYGEATTEAIFMMNDAYNAYKEEVTSDPVRQKEVTPVNTVIKGEDSEDSMDICTIELGDRRMQYSMEIIGDPDDDGLYPLYITLHGGGESTPEENNSQWVSMMTYYRDSVTNGIYVAVRGMEDVWNLHFLDDSYPMYDRLIEDMIMFENADPNRVYLLGFSAGGDGVYAVAPRMADRFAAANMSSGHPNDVSLLNTSNLPFEIQVGIRDYYSDTALRSIRGAEFEDTLNEYSRTFGFGYPHRVLVHVPEGHNYNDNFDVTEEFIEMYGLQDEDPALLKSNVLKDPSEFASRAVKEDWLDQFLKVLARTGSDPNVSALSYDSPDGFNEAIFKYVTEDLNMEVTDEEDTNAVRYVNSFTRDPVPPMIVWDLTTRAPKRKDTAFYWLKADNSVDQGLIKAVYDKAENKVYLEVEDEPNGEIKLLATPGLMDFDRPLTVETDKGEFTVDLKADKDIINASIRETGDMNLAWADEIEVDLGDGVIQSITEPSPD